MDYFILSTESSTWYLVRVDKYLLKETLGPASTETEEQYVMFQRAWKPTTAQIGL